MIVPASTLPSTDSPSPLGANDNAAQPSQAQLLLAAAEMHKLGRLGHVRPAPKPKLKPL